MSTCKRLALSLCRSSAAVVGRQRIRNDATKQTLAGWFSTVSQPQLSLTKDETLQIQESVFIARGLCNEFRFIVGSLPAPELEKAMSILNLLRAYESTNPEIVNASIDLYIRIVEELAFKNIRRPSLLKSRYFNPILNNWKQTVRSGHSTRTYQYILDTFMRLQERLPDLQLDVCFYGIVLDVLIHQEGRTTSAPLAEEFVQKYIPKPNAFIYGQLVTAWSQARNHPEAAERMEKLIAKMKKPSYATYNTLLQFWSQRGAVEKVESIINKFQLHTQWKSLCHLVPCYARTGDIDKAVALIERILQTKPTSRQEGDMVALGTAAQVVLKCIHQQVSGKSQERLDDETLSKLVATAEQLVRRLQESHIFDEVWREHQLGTLMHIYAQVGTEEQILSVVSQFQKPPAYLYSILIMFYGKRDRAGLAMHWLRKALEDARIQPTVGLFNSAIMAWADSSLPDATEQATDVIQMMETHHVCKLLNIQPDDVTFRSLLKLYVASKRKDAGERAYVILQEMERRSANVDAFAISLAAQACMVAKDLVRAVSCLGRLSPMDEKVFRNCLLAWPRMRTREAAMEVEEQLDEWDLLGVSDGASAPPGVISYNLAMRAWMISEDNPDAQTRVWQIYEKMHARSVEPDIVTYSELISYFAASADMSKARSLLNAMEHPEPRHFGAVMNGYLAMGDLDGAIEVLERRMDSYFGDPKAYPPVTSSEYERVLKAVDQNQTARVAELLHRIDCLHEEHGIVMDPIVSRSLDQFR